MKSASQISLWIAQCDLSWVLILRELLSISDANDPLPIGTLAAVSPGTTDSPTRSCSPRIMHDVRRSSGTRKVAGVRIPVLMFRFPAHVLPLLGLSARQVHGS